MFRLLFVTRDVRWEALYAHKGCLKARIGVDYFIGKGCFMP